MNSILSALYLNLYYNIHDKTAAPFLAAAAPLQR